AAPRPCSCGSLGELETGLAGQPPDVSLERDLEHVHVAPPPELALEWHRFGLNRPRAVAERLVAPEPVQQQPQVPVGHRVAEEEEVATPQLRAECDRNDARDLGLREVLGVAVLGADAALPLP